MPSDSVSYKHPVEVSIRLNELIKNIEAQTTQVEDELQKQFLINLKDELEALRYIIKAIERVCYECDRAYSFDQHLNNNRASLPNTNGVARPVRVISFEEVAGYYRFIFEKIKQAILKKNANNPAIIDQADNQCRLILQWLGNHIDIINEKLTSDICREIQFVRDVLRAFFRKMDQFSNLDECLSNSSMSRRFRKIEENDPQLKDSARAESWLKHVHDFEEPIVFLKKSSVFFQGIEFSPASQAFNWFIGESPGYCAGLVYDWSEMISKGEDSGTSASIVNEDSYRGQELYTSNIPIEHQYRYSKKAIQQLIDDQLTPGLILQVVICPKAKEGLSHALGLRSIVKEDGKESYEFFDPNTGRYFFDDKKSATDFMYLHIETCYRDPNLLFTRSIHVIVMNEQKNPTKAASKRYQLNLTSERASAQFELFRAVHDNYFAQYKKNKDQLGTLKRAFVDFALTAIEHFEYAALQMIRAFMTNLDKEELHVTWKPSRLKPGQEKSFLTIEQGVHRFISRGRHNPHTKSVSTILKAIDQASQNPDRLNRKTNKP